MELFRREALDGQDRLHGDIVFVPQISWPLLAAFFAAALALAALFLITADYRPATPVAGRLAARDGAIVAAFQVPAAATTAIAAGDRLRVSGPGMPRTLDARVVSLLPSRDGTTTIEAELREADAPGLRAGMTVRSALPARPRPLAVWLLGRLFGSKQA